MTPVDLAGTKIQAGRPARHRRGYIEVVRRSLRAHAMQRGLQVPSDRDESTGVDVGEK